MGFFAHGSLTFGAAIVTACALRPDLALLPQGDMTEVGEKGAPKPGISKEGGS